MRKPAAEESILRRWSVYTSHQIIECALGQQEILLSFRSTITENCRAHPPLLEETVFRYMVVGKP
jgi:hypothetical protein